jgi:hypothetical protein
VATTRRNFVLEPTHHEMVGVGPVTYVFDENTRRAGVFDPGFQVEVVRKLEQADFDPARDRLVVAGRIVPYSVALAAIVSRWGPVWALLFDSRERRYVALRIGETTRDERSSQERLRDSA